MEALQNQSTQLEDNVEQLMLAAGEENPIFFANYFLGIHLNPFNERALLSIINNKQVIWVTSNQIGKTVTLAVAHLWFNFYKVGFDGEPDKIDKARYETLNISPVSRQAKECQRYVEEILHSQFSWEENGKRFINICKIEWFWESKNENMGRIDFSNNSSFWCLSTSEDQGANLAGKQFGLISYDECVQSHHLEEELGARIFSRTAKYSGWMILVATPDEMGKSQQYWYDLYTTAKEDQENGVIGDWHLVEGFYYENIFIPEQKRREFIARLKRISPIKYKQVIEGAFLASVDAMFTLEMVNSLWNGKVEPTEPKLGHTYVLVIDWGVADQGDETVMFVADVTKIEDPEIVKTYAKQGGDPVELMGVASMLILDYNNCKVVMDAAEMGGIVFKKMMKQFSPISFGQGNKPDALFYTQLKLRNNLRKKLTRNDPSAISKLKSYRLPKLAKQLSSYKLDDKKIKQDWVMALCMLCWYIEKKLKTSKIKKFSLQKFYGL